MEFNKLVDCLLNKRIFEFIPHIEDMSFKGNCSAIDKETDTKTEDWIEKELNDGNQAAWFCAECRATYRGIVESDYLGACSYKSYNDFINDPYWQDMKQRCAELIVHTLQSHSRIYSELQKEAELTD